jgi:predicted short-subunit dehydrogenase-like oxidoreductase (DUF2520 family)
LLLSGSGLVLVGPGRAGSALSRSWIAAGGTLAAVVGRTRSSAEEAKRRLGAREAFGIAERTVARGDVLAVAVADDRIAEVASALAGRVSAPFAYHLSGALSAAELAPLRSGGAAIGSLHPLQVFTGAAAESWRGVLVAVEGEAAAVERGEAIVRALGARSHVVESVGKPLYHAGAALAAGGTAALLSFAVRLWERAGLPEDHARAALSELAAAAARAVGELPFADALTGPIARRDLVTIGAHAAAIEGTAVAGIYAALAEEVLRRTPGLGREEEVRSQLPREERKSRR